MDMNFTDVEHLEFPNDDPYPFKDFAPTLAQCFFIVIAGYLVAKFDILTANDQRGVNAFIGYIGMPSIICVTLADSDFTDLRWELVIGLLLGKCLIFVIITGFSFILFESAGIAGLLAVYSVHTNDLPVGNPLMSALYKDFRPHMMKYLFLMPALTMIVFVPIGNYMIQMHNKRGLEEKKTRMIANKETVLNGWIKCLCRKDFQSFTESWLKASPIILATLLGIVLNIIFKAKLPGFIHQPLKVMAATVPGLALSLLGFSMVRKERYLIGSSVVAGVVLVAVKMILTPLVLHSTVKVLTSESISSRLLSDFTLLYGVIAPATTIFQFGHEYRKPLASMSAALILASFACFPVSYVVARVTIAPTQKLSHYIPSLKTILFWIAWLSIASDVYTWVAMLLKKLWNKVPCCYVICLASTQLATSFGVLFWSLGENQPWSLYSEVIMYFGGEIFGYVWTGIVAVVLISPGRYPALAEKGFSLLCFTAFSISVVFTTVMCLLVEYNEIKEVYIVGSVNSNFQFLQLAATTTLLFICAIVVGVCLVIHFRKENKNNKISLKIKRSGKCGFQNVSYIESEEASSSYSKQSQSIANEYSAVSEQDEAEFYYEDILRNGDCKQNLTFGKEWTFKTFSLLLLLWLTMVVKLISNLYKLGNSLSLEIMIPLEYLQSILFAGQGVIILLTFGIDARTLSIGLRKWWRRMVHREEILPELSVMEGKSAIERFCRQFRHFYFSSCITCIARDRKWKDNVYKDCFWGHQLVDWLIKEGLSKDDVEAEEMGQKLLLGGVVKHVTQSHNFHDASYLYYFVKAGSDSKRIEIPENEMEYSTL